MSTLPYLQEYYRELAKLIYFKDGKPYWKISRMNVEKDSLAGCLDYGYRRIGFSINKKRKSIKVHRLRWFMEYGEFPNDFIDHINRDRDDNRIENLRVVTRSQNNRNRIKKSNTTSKYVGVSWYIPRQQWRTAIAVNGINYHIGLFDCEHCAGLAYDNALKKHGIYEYGNVNFAKFFVAQEMA